MEAGAKRGLVGSFGLTRGAWTAHEVAAAGRVRGDSMKVFRRRRLAGWCSKLSSRGFWEDGATRAASKAC